MPENPYIAVSGGFDPLTIGHVRMINDAAAFGKVIVLLNSDAWLMRKKGFVFMPFAERKEIIEWMKNIHCVLPAIDNDDTVCNTLTMLRETIQYFGNGGDRSKTNTPEIDLCERFGIFPIFGLGGNKIQSSSELVKNVRKGK